MDNDRYVFYNPAESSFAKRYGAHNRENINLADYRGDLPWVKEIVELEEHFDFARIYSGPLYETLRGLVMLQAEQESDYFRMRMTAEELDSLYRLLGGCDAEQAQGHAVTTCDKD